MTLGPGITLHRGLVTATANQAWKQIAFSVGRVCPSWKICTYWLNYKWLFTQFTIRPRLGRHRPADSNCPKRASITFRPVSEKDSSSLKPEVGPELFKVTLKVAQVLPCLIPHSFLDIINGTQRYPTPSISTEKEMRIMCSAMVTLPSSWSFSPSAGLFTLSVYK